MGIESQRRKRELIERRRNMDVTHLNGLNGYSCLIELEGDREPEFVDIATRRCLRCQNHFTSINVGNRICCQCSIVNSTKVWREYALGK